MRGRTVKALGWTASARLVVQVVQFGVTAVLARILSPEDFGLMAIGLVFTGFAFVFADLGVGQAVVWVGEASEELLATAFWINALAGLGMTTLLAATSPLIAHAMGDGRVQPLVAVVSLSFAVSLYVVHAARLQRSMRFRTIVTVEVLSTIGYGVVSITLAVTGFGAMSLAIGSVSVSLISTVAYWVLAPWHPRHGIDRASLRTIRAYSSGVLGSNALGYWSRNVDNLLVGRVLGVVTLGFYSRAFNLMVLPIQQVNAVVGRVLFPAFTAVRDDVERLRAAYLRVLTVLVALVVPLAAVLSTAAPALIETLYGARWASVAPLLTLLAASAPAQMVNTLNGPMYQALGRTGAQFRRSLISLVATVVAVVVGLHWGATGVCVALLVRYYVLLPNGVSGFWPALGMRPGLLVRRIRGVIAAGVLASLVAFGLGRALAAWPSWLLLIVQTGAAVVVYGLAVRVIDPATFTLVRRMGRDPRRSQGATATPRDERSPSVG